MQSKDASNNEHPVPRPLPIQSRSHHHQVPQIRMPITRGIHSYRATQHPPYADPQYQSDGFHSSPPLDGSLPIFNPLTNPLHLTAGMSTHHHGSRPAADNRRWLRIREWVLSEARSMSLHEALGAAAAVCTIVGLFTALH
ncbi:hypothetical protein DL93DRAFT_2084886 [Clavulina sp. PMI_390]|nr:hypothetical protein DL93DRAFT_2084886 [Clavulina sp. PMI_390]